MSDLPQIVRARLKSAPAGDHPDPDLLAAFAEQALPERERAPLLLHLSRCADCRDVLALSLPPTGPAPSLLDTAAHVPWFRWPVLRWGAVAACVVIVGSAVLMQRQVMMTRSAKAVSVRGDTQNDQFDYLRNAGPPPSSASSLAREQASSGTAMKAPSARLAAPAQAKALKQALPPIPPMAAPAPTVLEKKIAGGIEGGRVRGTTVGAMAAGAAQAWQTTPAAPPKEEAKNPAAESRDVPNLTIVPQASETVEVQAAAPALEVDAAAPADATDKHEAPGKAKPPSAAVMFDRMGGDSTAETVTASGAALSKEVAVKANRERASSVHAPVSRWTISSDGQLQHSIDSGKTWQPIAVADHATFRALSANGPDLWVGGASGLLYHSTDAGTHWTQIKPATAGSILASDIAAIEFTDVRQGKITTSTGEVWLTDDAGQTWHRQP
jgi:hypothetical protein